MPEEDKNFRHIVRVANTDLKGERNIVDALRKIKGVSFVIAGALCTILKVNPSKKAGELSDAELEKIDVSLKDLSKLGFPAWVFNRRKDYETGKDTHLLGPDLDYQKDNDIKRLKKIKAYRGSRHAFGLPVRGQRTRSNFRKNKGKVTGVVRSAVAKPAAAEGGKK